MDTDDETHEIVRIIVMLAHGLGLKVVAEGVENQEQVNLLLKIGCELGQGYLFSKPVPAAEIEKLLTTNRGAKSLQAKAASSTSA